jgi:hypothetical protein
MSCQSQQPAGGAVTAGTEGGGGRPGWQASYASTIRIGACGERPLAG